MEKEMERGIYLVQEKEKEKEKGENDGERVIQVQV